MSFVRSSCFAAAAVLTAAAFAHGQATLTTTRVASGLTQPLQAVSTPADPGHLYIVERAGRVKVLDLATNTVSPQLFLDISTIVETS